MDQSPLQGLYSLLYCLLALGYQSFLVLLQIKYFILEGALHVISSVLEKLEVRTILFRRSALSRSFISFYKNIAILLSPPKKGVSELMDRVVLVFDFGEVVEVELSQEGAVVAVPEMFGQEGAAEFVGLVDHEGGVAGGPADEALVLGLAEDEGEF